MTRLDVAPPPDDPVVSLRPPRGPEVRACRMLLPEAAAWGSNREDILAVAERPLRFLGAAAHAPARHRDGRPGLRVALRVAEPDRRRGIGSRLLGALVAAARSRGVDALAAWYDPDKEPGADGFLRARGFTLAERFLGFEADLSRLAEYLLPRRDWMIERGEVPADARLVPLREAPIDRVADLLAAHIGGVADDIDALIRETLDRGTITESRALMVGDEVQGVLIGKIAGEVAEARALAVAAPYQGGALGSGWAVLWLMATVAEIDLALGVRRFRFDCAEANRNVLKIASRCGAQRIRTRDIYTLDLGPA